MSPTATAVFAQVIPVLLIAAFLTVRMNRNDHAGTIAGIGYGAIGVTAEATCLLLVALDVTAPKWLMGAILAATFLMLVSLLATLVVHLNQTERDDHK
ncbi:MAG TPA: hypothetical protein VL294_11265 [Pseudolysinimonas sp.]|jgi:hypothetical protein|nr:hypothetical protein [Pseudolysinimonas sp.]